MKRATAATLDRLKLLLAQLRPHDRLKENSRGVFCCRSRAVLHFHEDPAGLFADLRESGDWQRFAVNTAPEQAALVLTIARFVAAR
ncbi:hypothetical protein [Reyranella sp.]|uniref:hypothetical protein n=1 Tax=Reyranella sp. TaxID=1929291 RepID=UPI0037843314